MSFRANKLILIVISTEQSEWRNLILNKVTKYEKSYV